MKILVLRFSSIGDVIWVSPVVRCLKEQLAGAEVHFCTKKSYADLFAYNPYVSRLHLLDSSLEALIAELRTEKFDIIIDLHNNFRTRYLKYKLGVKSYTYNKLNLAKWLYIYLKINCLPTNHIADRYLQTLAPLGVKPDGKGLELYTPPELALKPDFFPASHRRGFIAFVIGASYTTKKLPFNRLLEVCQNVAQPIVLVGGKEDAPTAQMLMDYLATQEPAVAHRIFDTCGRLSLLQSALVVQQAAVVIGHDTGLMHIAACFQKKIYSIWGSTVPLFGLYPYQTPHEIIENTALSCRPCSRMGKKKCPKGHFKCMKELDLSKIYRDLAIPK